MQACSPAAAAAAAAKAAAPAIAMATAAQVGNGSRVHTLFVRTLRESYGAQFIGHTNMGSGLDIVPDARARWAICSFVIARGDDVT